MRTATATNRQVRYSVPMVAAMLDAPKKEVDRIVDEKVLPASLTRRISHARAREISMLGVKLIALELELRKEIRVKKTRSRIYKAIKANPAMPRFTAGRFVTVELSEHMNEISTKIENYESLMDLIEIDPGIQHGEPVFKGTRVTVYNIAGMLEHGETDANMLEGYPTLRQEHLDAARLYARANPRRGRPAMKLPPPVHTTRIPLQDL